MRRAESVEFAMRAEGDENGKDSESDWRLAGGELGMDWLAGRGMELGMWTRLRTGDSGEPKVVRPRRLMSM